MKKTQTNYCCADIYREDRRIRVEEDSTLPDYCSDIVRVVKVDATPFITSQKAYIRDGTLFFDIEGSLRFNAVYVTESGALESHGFTTTFFDSVKADAQNVDPDSLAPLVTVSAENVICKVQSPRRMSMRAEVSLCSDIKGNIVCECYNKGKNSLVEAMERNAVSLRIADSAEADFKIREMITLPSSLPPMERILSSKISLVPESSSAGDGRVNFWGNIALTCIYVPEYEGDGGDDLRAFYQPLEIRGSVEMHSAASDMAALTVLRPVSFECEIQSNTMGENRILKADIAYSAQCAVMENSEAVITEDIYGIGSELTPIFDRREFKKFIGTLKDTSVIKKKAALKSGITSLEGADAEIRVRDVATENGNLVINSRVTVEGIGVGESKCSVSESFDIPLRLSLPSEALTDNAVISFDLYQYTDFVEISSDSVNVNIALEITTVAHIYTSETQSCVVDIKEGEKLHEREGTVFCYPTEDDTMWKIGKRYGVSIEALSKANSVSDGQLRRVMIIP